LSARVGAERNIGLSGARHGSFGIGRAGRADPSDLAGYGRGARNHHQVAQTSQFDAPLEIGAAAESVEVQADVSPLDTETVAQGTVVSNEKIQALPLNGRQFLQLALLSPGVNEGGIAVQQDALRQGEIGGLSVAGTRTNDSAYLLDGVINTDPDYNALAYVPIVDAIAEFQVQVAQYSAEYGRASPRSPSRCPIAPTSTTPCRATPPSDSRR
jgi:hypothetical protein